MNRFLFKDRNGRTPLPLDYKKDLHPTYKHIQYGEDLDKIEEANIIDGLIWLDDCSEPCDDIFFWEQLHKKLFGKVWLWAGRLRKIELMNEEFDHPGDIAENIKKLEGDLKFWLQRKPFPDERQAIVQFHERFLTIHPFNNGNGRTCRILTEYICRKHQIAIPTWGFALKRDSKAHREAYIESLIKARRKFDYKELLIFMYS